MGNITVQSPRTNAAFRAAIELLEEVHAVLMSVRNNGFNTREKKDG